MSEALMHHMSERMQGKGRVTATASDRHSNLPHQVHVVWLSYWDTGGEFVWLMLWCFSSFTAGETGVSISREVLLMYLLP